MGWSGERTGHQHECGKATKSRGRGRILPTDELAEARGPRLKAHDAMAPPLRVTVTRSRRVRPALSSALRDAYVELRFGRSLLAPTFERTSSSRGVRVLAPVDVVRVAVPPPHQQDERGEQAQPGRGDQSGVHGRAPGERTAAVVVALTIPAWRRRWRGRRRWRRRRRKAVKGERRTTPIVHDDTAGRPPPKRRRSVDLQSPPQAAAENVEVGGGGGRLAPGLSCGAGSFAAAARAERVRRASAAEEAHADKASRRGDVRPGGEPRARGWRRGPQRGRSPARGTERVGSSRGLRRASRPVEVATARARRRQFSTDPNARALVTRTPRRDSPATSTLAFRNRSLRGVLCQMEESSGFFRRCGATRRGARARARAADPPIWIETAFSSRPVFNPEQIRGFCAFEGEMGSAWEARTR